MSAFLTTSKITKSNTFSRFFAEQTMVKPSRETTHNNYLHTAG